jgi:uncharacterized membrane protein YjjP (DUF1212 family)
MGASLLLRGERKKKSGAVCGGAAGRTLAERSNTMDVLPPERRGSLPSLESIAMAALDAGRLLMEAGASAKSVEGIVEMFAHSLGAERVALRIGYASLAISIAIDGSGITRMRKVGQIGVNQRLEEELWHLAERASRQELTADETSAELARLARETPRHSPWVTAVAVGLACAAFGRLLGVDWHGTVPVFVAATLGQYIRHELLIHRMNVFICTAVVSSLSSLIGSLGARWAGSETITLAMIASILLLVPGVAAVNAQSDILEGYPTLGSARALTVLMTLIFIAAGLWVGPVLLNLWH